MKRKKTGASQTTEAKPQHKKHQGSPLASTFLPILLGLAIAAAVLLQLNQSITAQQTSEQASQLATAYNQQLDLLLGMADANAKTLPASTPLVNAILRQDDEAIVRLEREWAQAPYLSEVVIMQPGSQRADKSLSFSALDHLGLAATSQQSALEYVTSGDKQLFYQASPILHPQQTRIIGTLLLIYDARSMLERLAGASTDARWQVSLHQQLPQAPMIELYRTGPGLQDPATQSFATQHPYWTLAVAVDRPSLLQSPWLSHYLALLLVLLFTALAALLVLRGKLRQQLTANIAAARNALGDNQPQLLEELAGTALQPLAEPLRKLLRRSNGNGSPVPADSHAGTAAEKAVEQQAPQPEKAPQSPVPTPAGTIESTPAESFLDDVLDDVLDIDILDMELDESILQSEQVHAPAASQPRIDAGIFRAYDIRGIVGTNLDAETAYWIGRAVGSESIARGEARIVVGRDGRLSGQQLAAGLIRGLTETGCTVLDLGMVPTPLVYFGTHQLDASSGVMVTGSHNPPDYNGFKVVIAGETLASERITALYQRIVKQDILQGEGAVQQVNLLDQYVDYISDDVAIGNPLKVVVDCGNGVAGVVAPRLLEELGCIVSPLYCEVDGNFPNHHPDPGKPENLQDLIRKVQEDGADLGLAFDGDGDRLGVVTNKGEIIYPDRLMMLLAKDVVSRNPGCDIVYDVKCTRRLAALISRCGGRPVMWKTGHSLMKAKLRETGALLAGEMSGHIFFKERWFGFDDGIYAAARLLEILSMEVDSADQVFARYPVCPSTPELTIEVTEDSKFAIIEALQSSADWNGGSLTTLDGIRVDYPKGWGLIRASNTTPMLVLRFEGDSEEDLQQIQNLFRDRLLAVAPDIHWPF